MAAPDLIRPSEAISSVTATAGVAEPVLLVPPVTSTVETFTVALPAESTEATSRTSVRVTSELTGTCCELTVRDPLTVVWRR